MGHSAPALLLRRAQKARHRYRRPLIPPAKFPCRLLHLNAAPANASAAKTRRKAVMVNSCAGVYQSLSFFFGGVGTFLGDAPGFGGGASSALSISSNCPR